MKDSKIKSIISWVVFGLAILLISEWETTKQAANDAWQGVYVPIDKE